MSQSAKREIDCGCTPGQATPVGSRRWALKQSAVGFGHLAFTALLGSRAAQTVRASSAEPALASPLAAKPPHLPARAKRIIFLFMKGGPSHVDTFDPKPLLDRDHGKPLPFPLPRVTFAAQGNLLKSPWRFRQYGESGLPVSDLFPHVARHVDDLCILRSVHGTNPAHGGALLKLHTGSDQFVRPSMGAWVIYGLGTENENLPAFVTICPTLAHGGVNNWGAAFLPAYCQGTPIGNASQSSLQAQVRNIRNARLSTTQQRLQLDLIGGLHREQLTRSARRPSRPCWRVSYNRSSWRSACRPRCPKRRIGPASPHLRSDCTVSTIR